MRRHLRFLVSALIGITLMGAHTGRAETLTIGELSFDSGVAPGVNTFDLFNFTGGFLGNDAIADSELFSGSLSVTVSGGGVTVYDFSGIDLDGGTIASVLTGTDVLSAQLSLTLSNYTGVNILDDGGNPVVTNLQSVTDTVLSDVPLTACDGSGAPCSQSLITVDTATVSAVPEPATLWMMGIGLSALAGLGRRIHKGEQS